MIDFIKKFQILEIFFFIFFYYIFFLCYYCSINLKRQSEHSGLCPDTSSLVFFFDLLSFIDFVKRKGNSSIDQRKGYEKHDQLLVSKVEFNFQISQRNKSSVLLFDPVFSNWVNLSINSQSLFVLEIRRALGQSVFLPNSEIF